MQREKITAEDSITIIEQSLKQSASQKTGAANYYIIWGLLIFIFLMGYFIAFHFPNETTKSITNVLPNLFAIGGILSYLQSRKDNKNETNVPLNEKIYAYAWIGASISLGALCVSNLRNMPEMFCIGILISFGFANFMIGSITKFTPLIIGGVLAMVLTVLISYVTVDYQFLITAIGVLSTCLVPGLLMKNSKTNV